MKVGIIGAGTSGRSLGKALLKAGHEVMFSSRDPQGDKAKRIHKETGAPVNSIEDTLAFSPITVIAMAADAIPELIKSHPGVWANRIIIDLNNRMSTPANSAGSFAQDLAHLTKGRVVKAFNILGVEHYQNPVFNGQKAMMLIAGSDAEARKTVAQLASDIGFDVTDIGGIENSVLLEDLARLWVHLAYNVGLGRNFAFGLLRK